MPQMHTQTIIHTEIDSFNCRQVVSMLSREYSFYAIPVFFESLRLAKRGRRRTVKSFSDFLAQL